MFISLEEKLTFAEYFVRPANTTHRQYEALRAFFVEGLKGEEAASRFGYTAGSFRTLVHQFRKDPKRRFFLAPVKGPKASKRQDALREKIIKLRKQNLSIYDISEAITKEEQPISAVTVSNVLKEEGFARLPRRLDEERPPGARPTAADVADANELNLEVRQFETRFGGLFLFVPLLVDLKFDKLINGLDLPGLQMVPASCAIRSLLGLKLFGNARRSHVMSHVLDEGLALFAGLNVIPKRSFLTEYSCRIAPTCYPKLMRRWFDAVGRLRLERGTSFDLDFHTIPFHGEEALVEKHYVSKRSRRQKGILAFLAQDADTRVLCYANANLRKADQNDEILMFAKFWKQRTGHWPEELIFDSRLTTYTNLNRLNRDGIRFITLRRRTAKLLEEIAQRPKSAWRRIELEGVSRKFRRPRILDERITLRDYDGPLRQLIVTDLGHEEPTLLITNQLRRGAAKLVGRYAKRMLIENEIEDGIDFFHMDALSSAVALKVHCDLQLTLMGSSLYRLLASQIGQGYERAKSRTVFDHFVDATATINIRKHDIVVRFQKRAHNPLLLAAAFDKMEVKVPWLGRRPLRFVFG